MHVGLTLRSERPVRTAHQVVRTAGSIRGTVTKIKGPYVSPYNKYIHIYVYIISATIEQHASVSEIQSDI